MPVNNRNLSSSLPVHIALIDSFTPCELSCSVLGYAYGIVETAVTWIMRNGKQWRVCSYRMPSSVRVDEQKRMSIENAYG